jgi:hypothetical protein
MTTAVASGRMRREAKAWGRTPGRRPPLPGWTPLAWFVALAGVLTFVVVALVRPPGPLDDSDPAYQRDGLLLSGPVVPEQVLGVDFGGEPVVLLFLRRLPEAGELAQWTAAVPERADVRVVVPAATDVGAETSTVVDPLNRLAGAVEMPVPVDGGRPVGYAVVDSDRVVRYATLDPEYLANVFEIQTIVGAVA